METPNLVVGASEPDVVVAPNPVAGLDLNPLAPKLVLPIKSSKEMNGTTLLRR